VLPPAKAFQQVARDGAYPEQPTSWAAVYHVLQRYGAYVALKRFSNTFDAGDQFVAP